jgi:hypothetical protein
MAKLDMKAEDIVYCKKERWGYPSIGFHEMGQNETAEMGEGEFCSKGR